MSALRLPLLFLSFLAHYQPFTSASLQQKSFLSDTRITHNQVRHVLEHTPAKVACCTCNLTGPIEATQCNYETIENVNGQLYQRLHALVDTPYFKYLKIDLTRDCPFWQDNPFCVLKDCAVTTVDESELPENWRAECLSQLKRPDSDALRGTFPGCYYRDSDFCVLDDDTSPTTHAEYVDLSLNPERFTGYRGEPANRVWKAIYEENCFGLSEETVSQIPDPLMMTSPAMQKTPMGHLAKKVAEDEVCLEKKVYYRIISGLHASISTHVCYEYMDQKTGEWHPNLQCFIDRIASHPERLQYIYFNTVLLLRAVSRAGRYLDAYDLRVADDIQEDTGRRLLSEIIDISNVVGAFDETTLFQGEDAEFLKEEFKHHFRNVTRIMDCVGCDKCRLWGKIQTTGIATALKILFEFGDSALDPQENPNLLSRSEVVTLLNTLHRFSESIQAVEVFRKLWAEQQGKDGSITNVEVKAEQDDIHEPNTRFLSSTSPFSSAPRSSHANIQSSPLHLSTPKSSSPSSSSTAVPSPQLSPQSTSLSSRFVRYLFYLWDSCQKNTAACLHFGATIVERVLNAVSSVFRLSGKDDIPTRSDL